MVCDKCLKKISQLRTENEKFKKYFGKIQVESSTKYTSKKCLMCGSQTEGSNKYCMLCAHNNGICEMCGEKIFEREFYKVCDYDRKDYLRKKRNLKLSRDMADSLAKEKKLKGAKERKKIDLEELMLKKHQKEYLKKKVEKKEEKKEFVKLEKEEPKDDEFDEVVNL